MPLTIGDVPIHYLNGCVSFHYLEVLPQYKDIFSNIIILGDDHEIHIDDCYQDKTTFINILKNDPNYIDRQGIFNPSVPEPVFIDEHGIFMYDQVSILSTKSKGWYKLLDTIGTIDKPVRYFIEGYYDRNLLKDPYYTSLPQNFNNPLNKSYIHGMHYIPTEHLGCMTETSSMKCITNNIKYYFSEIRHSRLNTKYSKEDNSVHFYKCSEFLLYIQLTQRAFDFDDPQFTTYDIEKLANLALGGPLQEFAVFLFSLLMKMHNDQNRGPSLLIGLYNQSKNKDLLYSIFIEYMQLCCEFLRIYTNDLLLMPKKITFQNDYMLLQQFKNQHIYIQKVQEFKDKLREFKAYTTRFFSLLMGALNDIYCLFELSYKPTSICVYHCGYNHGVLLSYFLTKKMFIQTINTRHNIRELEVIYGILGLPSIFNAKQITKQCVRVQPFTGIDVTINSVDKINQRRIDLLGMNLFIHLLEGNVVSKEQLKKILKITDDKALDTIISLIQPKVALF